jgi:hypothetical protein
LWYAIVPVAGAIYRRYEWFRFRNRFNALRLRPVMEGRSYWEMGSGMEKLSSSIEGTSFGESQKPDPGLSDQVPSGQRFFRFTGKPESVTEDSVLWVRGEDLTVPVLLKNAETYIFPMRGGEDTGIPAMSDPGDEAPEKVHWKTVSSSTEGAKVFVGGTLSQVHGRLSFVSTKKNPLTVIFYDGDDSSLAAGVIWAGRQGGEYFNRITPYSILTGGLCLLILAATFLPRPAFRPTVIAAIAAIFTPLLPLVPPGILFTAAYRRLTRRSRILRSYSDLAKLPLLYFETEKPKKENGGTGKAGFKNIHKNAVLPGGEVYGCVQKTELPAEVQDGKIPMLIAEAAKRGGHAWHIFGVIRPSETVPVRPLDPFATFGALPGNPAEFARHCTVKAYITEAAGWILLLTGIGLSGFFLRLIVPMLV